jgi:iron complex transport system substrate-binding protein
MRRFVLRGLILSAITLTAAPVSAADAPKRVVSFNLCGDQLVLALADPGQIVGLSPFARDEKLSTVAPQAGAFPKVVARSEAAVALQPDLVLAGPIDRAGIRRTLTRAGLRVVDVELVNDIAAARAQVLEFGVLLGHPERGRALAEAIDRAQARLAEVARGRNTTALLVERKGYVTGPESLAAALLRAAGFEPPAGAPEGLGGFVPLERLLVLRPDVLALYEAVAAPTDQGALFLAHPALAKLYPPARQLVLPRKFALCGGPALVAALDYLTARLSAPETVSVHAAMMPDSASSPSVSAAGPGCRMMVDLISRSQPVRTAGIAPKPSRATTFAGTNFLPHHEPMTMSGALAIISSRETVRSFALLWDARPANTSSPPATAMSSDTQPIPEIIGSSHSSK